MNCICCKKLLSNTDKRTCDKCMYYVDESLVCQRCNRSYTRTNRNRNYRSYKCRVSIVIEFDLMTVVQFNLNCNIYDETFRTVQWH